MNDLKIRTRRYLCQIVIIDLLLVRPVWNLVPVWYFVVFAWNPEWDDLTDVIRNHGIVRFIFQYVVGQYGRQMHLSDIISHFHTEMGFQLERYKISFILVRVSYRVSCKGPLRLWITFGSHLLEIRRERYRWNIFEEMVLNLTTSETNQIKSTILLGFGLGCVICPTRSIPNPKFSVFAREVSVFKMCDCSISYRWKLETYWIWKI
jgi:hypothetical protein